ncbi:hypothetical protein [Krasilnikovia sp. M28-CT-15]|uniref:hypothetical protein n=1 Tax=Krasilnikovia sp. M28-CT-15 TaxID=3373540 RepID=UPI00399CAB83
MLAFAVMSMALPWPRAIVDPTSVGGPARQAIPWLLAGFTFLSYGTLTVFAYCLLIGGASEANKKFVAAVLNRAGIGAALGALVGLRVAPVLLQAPGGNAGQADFTDCLSDVGNIVTMLTLMFVGTAWKYSFAPVNEAAATLARHVEWLKRYSDGAVVRKLIPFILLWGINLVAFQFARTIFFEVSAIMK